MSMDGINRLIAVTQMKANEQLDATSDSQQLVGQTAQNTIGLVHGMGIAEVNHSLDAFSWANNVFQSDGSLHNLQETKAHHPEQFFQQGIQFNATISGFASAEELSNAYRDPKLDVGGGLQGIKDQLQKALEGPQGSDDQQLQFEIQGLMSDYNEAQNLAADVAQKKSQSDDSIWKNF